MRLLLRSGLNRQGDYSGRRDWPGGGQSNWLLTGFDSRSKWLGRVTTVNIALDRDKPIPLARQIQAHLERLIRERLLAPGMKLPATRELAHSLGVNRGTVAEAYEELVAAGWARAHVGQGTFVTESPGAPGASEPRRTSGGPPSVDGDLAAPAPLAPAPLDWPALLSRSAQIIAAEDERARTLVSAATSNPAVISFAGGMPDSGLFPTDAFRRVLNQVIRDEGASLLQYYPAGGYPPLRRYLSTYLLRFGLEARPEEILIVNGSQQGFDLIARTLIDQGDTVAIEQPTYPRALQVFRSFGAQLAPVPWDAVGPRVEVFERLLDRHAARVAREYARRRALLLTALKRRMPAEVTWTEPQGGFSLLLTLPPGLDATELLPAAIERGVAFTPGAPFFMDGAGAGTLRLSFSSVAAGRIDEGVRRLGETIKAARPRPRGRGRLEPATVPVV